MIDVDALRPGPPWAANRAPMGRRPIAHLRRANVNSRTSTACRGRTGKCKIRLALCRSASRTRSIPETAMILLPRASRIHAYCLLTLVCFAAVASAEPLSVEIFFQKAKYGQAVLSPSGRFLAVATQINGRQNVGVLDLDTRKVEPVTAFERGDVLRLVWQNDQRMTVVIGDVQSGTGEPPRLSGIL